MTELINALDDYTSMQIGENGHAEYGWSNSIQERIVQFSFQVTRTTDDIINKLSQTLFDILNQLKHKMKNGTFSEKEVAKGHLSILYRMIGHTRDIIDGKGECTLSYMMIHTWYKFFPRLAFFALKCFVDLEDKNVHQYGSWKDIKYFCKYCISMGEPVYSDLIQFSITLINKQLKKDYTAFLHKSSDVSLAAKWVPREKSSFGWLYEPLATNYFDNYLETAKTDVQIIKSILKCKTEYRKLLSKINRYLDTLQIKQCEKGWRFIDFDKVTSISLSKQKKAFLNIKKNGEVRFSDNNDRIECAANFNAHIQRSLMSGIDIKGKRVSMGHFTKQAIELIKNGNQYEKNLLNSQWRDNIKQSSALGKMIAMVDVSGSMDGEPMNVAIALGIRIAEKSIIGNRIMTFSSKPTWVNLEHHDDFISKVDVIQNANWGMNTNFYAALDIILDAIVQNKMPPDDVQDMVLVILSDMQIDSGDNCDKNALYDTMEKKYSDAGLRVHGKPYKPPHILFWNLRSTSGFPSLSNQKNTSLMSGFSPSLLNIFCDQGISALQGSTPWSQLNRILDNDRYKIMDSELKKILSR